MVQELPLISVITPSFNQADYIQQTIESVLMQDYPNIEHIVIDGCSTDRTLEVLNQYSHLGERFRFVTEPDRGQSHAINKGLKMVRGAFIGWLNSDDTYLPWAVSKAIQCLTEHPEWGMVYGRGYYTNDDNQVIGRYPDEPFNKKRLFEGCIICQPAAFMRREAFESAGGVNESLQFCMDYDLWMRISKCHSIGFINDYLANFRVHSLGKSSNQYVDVGLPEILKSSIKNYGTIANSWLIEFIRGYLPKKGIHWIINQFKRYSVFGNCPIVHAMNRYHDFWVSPHFNLEIKIDPNYPLDKLMISGRYPLFGKLKKMTCEVYADGKYITQYQIKSRDFMLEIPICSTKSFCTVELKFDKSFVPQKMKMNHDTRILSAIVDDVLPLSAMEYDFYMVLKNKQKALNQWLYSNRQPNPWLEGGITE